MELVDQTTGSNDESGQSAAGALPEPIPVDVRTFVTDNIDLDAATVQHHVAALQDTYEFLTDLAAHYLLAQQHGLQPAYVFETVQRQYSLDIDALQPEMNSVDLTADIQQITDINTFEKDDGSTGKVCNLILSDDTGTSTLTLWDDTTALAEAVTAGDTVRLENGYSKVASDFCQRRFGRDVEVRIGDGHLLTRDGDDWNQLN